MKNTKKSVLNLMAKAGMRSAIKSAGEDAYVIGEIKAGEKGVELC